MLIRYFASASEAAGVESQVIDSSQMDVAKLIAELGTGNQKLAKILAVSSLLADGRRIDDPSTSLAGVKQLDVLPPFAGG